MHILQQCELGRFLVDLPEEDLDGAKHVVSKLSNSEEARIYCNLLI